MRILPSACRRTARDLATRYKIEVTPDEVDTILRRTFKKIRAKLAKRGWWVEKEEDLVELIREAMRGVEGKDYRDK
jgi:hypothetical protein